MRLLPRGSRLVALLSIVLTGAAITLVLSVVGVVSVAAAPPATGPSADAPKTLSFEVQFSPFSLIHVNPTPDPATGFGLGGSVFSDDVDRARRVAERVESGMVWINHPTSSQADLPFGGVKRSGFGRELSHLGMFEFTNRKLIRTLPPHASKGQVAG